VVAGAAGAAATASASERRPAAAKAIPIGVILDTSGPFKSFGTDIKAAVTLAAGRHRGANGAKLNLVFKDSSGRPDQAVIAERELADDGVFAIVGPISSGESEVTFAQASQIRIPIITGTANKPGITTLGHGWAFRDTATNDQIFARVLPIFTKRYKAKKVAMIYDARQPVASSAATGTLPPIAAKLGVQIVETLTVQTGQTDFTSVVQRVKAARGIKGVFVMTGPVEGGLLARELARQDVKHPVLGLQAQNSRAFRQTAGSSLGVWVVPSIFFAPAVHGGLKFVKDLRKATGNPTPVPESATYYDIIGMIAKVARGAKITGSTTTGTARQRIRDGLAKIKNYPGIAGRTTFLKNGDVNKQIYALRMTRTGAKRVTLKSKR
jgi:branched-chain amino acid transport system substrate-binding protein